MGAVSRKLTSLQHQYDSLVADFDSLKLRSEEDIEKVRSEYQAVSEQLATVNSEKEQLQILIADYLQKISELEERYALESENHENTLTSLHSQIEESNHKLTAKESEIESLKAQLDTLSTKLSALLEEKNSKISKLTEALRNSQDSLQSKTEDCESLKVKLGEAQQNLPDKELLDSLRHDISSKQEEIAHLELQIRKLNEDIFDIRKSKELIKTKLEEKEQECSVLQSTMKDICDKNSHIFETERSLTAARHNIEELERIIQSLPSEDDLISRDNEIARLNRIIAELKSQIEGAKKTAKKQEKISDEEDVSSSQASNKQASPKKSKTKYRKFKFPYITKPSPLSENILKTKDFPKIENDNIYSSSSRTIDEVYDCRTNRVVSAKNILLKWTVEEISNLRNELYEAAKSGKPYLICPCCRQMLMISSRTVGFGEGCLEVQYFTHAVRNIPCDLKRDNTYDIEIDGSEVYQLEDTDYFNEIRSRIKAALTSENSVDKGISDVSESAWIESDGLPVMKRRLADVTALYNGRKLVFEFVTPTTNLSKVLDRDIFYYINNCHVFWLFGIYSTVDYNELLRSVAKDIIFANKRNVFVFDFEAQQESQRQGELMLKCNWLDEDNEWNFQLEKNGKNGILISLDQVKFNDDSCRPYYYEADEPYFIYHPSAERPAMLLREELMTSIKNAWEYKNACDDAVKQMGISGEGVEAFFNGEKWGFRYGSLIFIEPTFENEPEIFGAYAKVYSDGKYGVVDRFGVLVLNTSYEAVEVLPDNRLLYSDGKEWRIFGIIDPLTAYTSRDEIKTEVSSETENLYRLTIEKKLYVGQLPDEFIFFGDLIFKKDKSQEKWILWYSMGGKITDKTWDNIEITSDNQLRLYDGKKAVILFQDGTVGHEALIKESEYLEKISLKNGFFIVRSSESFWGLLDDNNDFVISPQYDSIEKINDDYLKFLSDGKWGILSINGDRMIEPEYNSILSYCDGVFLVTIPNPDRSWENLTGKIDLQGNRLSEKVYDLNSTLRITRSFERLGLESDKGIVICHKYESLRRWIGDKYRAKKNGLWGIIDINNDSILFPFEYSKISALVNYRAVVNFGSRIFYINSDCQIIEDEVIPLQDGYQKIKREDKWGIIGPDSTELVAPKYDEITTFRGQLIGIINDSLIKLGVFYPYRLQMSGIIKRVDGKDMVQVSTILFQLLSKRKSTLIDARATIALVNWADNMKYPAVIIATESKLKKRAKHIDLPDDFCVGESVEGKIIRVKKSKRTIKSIDVVTTSGKETHVYAPDFNNSGILTENIEIDKTICLTKKDYDSDLDRTIWRIDKL